MVFAVAEDGVAGTGDSGESSEVGRESGRKERNGIRVLPGCEELFELLLLGRAADDERAGPRAGLGCCGFCKGIEDLRVEAEAQVVIGGEAKAVATVGDAVNGSGANGGGPGSTLGRGGELLQGRGQALLEAGTGHGGLIGWAGAEAG